MWYLRDRCWSLPCTWTRRVLWCRKIWHLAWWRWDPSPRIVIKLCRSMCYTLTGQPANMQVGAIVNHLCDDFISAKAVNHRVNYVNLNFSHIMKTHDTHYILNTSIRYNLIIVQWNLCVIQTLYKQKILHHIYFTLPHTHIILYVYIFVFCTIFFSNYIRLVYYHFIFLYLFIGLLITYAINQKCTQMFFNLQALIIKLLI